MLDMLKGIIMGHTFVRIGLSQNRVKNFYLYNVKIALVTPSLPSIFTDLHSRTFMMVPSRKHANIMMEKLPSTLT